MKKPVRALSAYFINSKVVVVLTAAAYMYNYKSLVRTNNHAVCMRSEALISRICLFVILLPSLVRALPLFYDVKREEVSDPVKALTAEGFYLNLFTSVFLVLAGGVFAGLTLGLMGQDEVYLKVIASSGDVYERKHARKVLNLIGRGKHWVLVTLLLSNVITNETLPIVLDRCLGGGWPAVVTSTASIVVFGEIIPQSICVRYGLQVGALFAPFVLMLMYLMYPIAYPCSLLLDHILGEDHGTLYKKSGLKTLVTLHKTMGVERLNEDEVTIISAVLDLKEKPVSHIMTPIDRVYTMSADAVLDEETVEEIFNAGFSRIPIHIPGEPFNFIGMLLVRVLISYDPEDALPVALFPLATLPETGADTSCLNILNYFQEGKSHMIVVSEHPGEPVGALGVLTLEDVIEELIGEEIVDESDVYIDINKNIKRQNPGPLSKKNLSTYLRGLYRQPLTSSKRSSFDDNYDLTPLKESLPKDSPLSNKGYTNPGVASPLFQAADTSRNWLPKNPASNPLETSKSFVKIKKTDLEQVKNNVTPSRKRLPLKPFGINYGAIHPTENAALRTADKQFNEGRLSSDSQDAQRFHIADKSQNDVACSNELSTNDQQVANEDDDDSDNVHYNVYDGTNNEVVPEYAESRSYRTGGIVESVINVKGVHKTIIEHISDGEGQSTQSAMTPHSTRSVSKSSTKSYDNPHNKATGTGISGVSNNDDNSIDNPDYSDNDASESRRLMSDHLPRA